MKGKLSASAGEFLVCRSLVVFQFAVSIILIISVLVVYLQIHFIHTKNLGYDRDNIIVFSAEGKLEEGQDAFFNELKQFPEVRAVASFGHDLIGNHGGTTGVDWPGRSPEQRVRFGNLEIGHCRHGAVRPHWKDHQIMGTGPAHHRHGQRLSLHFLVRKCRPLFFQCYPDLDNILVKIRAGKEQPAISRIAELYSEYNQGITLEYRFLDKDYQELYAAKNRVAILSRYFAGMAILISCLGLFGLATFTAERRAREIGIRKIPGSDTFDIVRLLSADFTKMVLLAILIAMPISYLLAREWLADFAYRIDLRWWFFVGAALTTLLIAWLTIGTQTLRAAMANPVNSLKEE